MVQYQNKVLHFVDLKRACNHYLKQASESPLGSFYNCMTAMIYAAFLIEAYLNEIGDHLLPDWIKKHDAKTVKDKMKLIGEALNTTFDLGQAPFQSINEIMIYRNLVVHSKAQNLSEDVPRKMVMRNDYTGPPSTLDKTTTIDNAKRFSCHAVEIVGAINIHMPTDEANKHPILHPDEDPFSVLSEGGTL